MQCFLFLICFPVRILWIVWWRIYETRFEMRSQTKNVWLSWSLHLWAWPNKQKRIKNGPKLNSGLHFSVLLMKHSLLRWSRQTLFLSVLLVATWTGPRLLARCRLWELHGFNSCNNAHLIGSDISFVALFQSKSYPWVQKHHEKSTAECNSREQVNSLNNCVSNHRYLFLLRSDN